MDQAPLHQPSDPLSLLRAVDLFMELPEEELRAVAGRLGTASYVADQTVVREGQPGHAWYVLTSGRAVVLSTDLVGLEVTLATLEPGDHFGEVALLTGGPRAATVKAIEAVDVLVLDRDAFQRLEARCPQFAARVRSHVDLLGIDAFLRKASPFARLPDATIRRLAGQLRAEHVGAGETIVREGESGDRFYLVSSGTLEATKGGRLLQMLEPGDCFGEVALLASVPRAATVRAITDSDVLSLGKEEFEAVIGQHDTLRRQLREFVRIRVGDVLARSIASVDPVTLLMPELSGHRRLQYLSLLLAGLVTFAVLVLLAAAFRQSLLAYAAILQGSFVAPLVYLFYLADSHVLSERRWHVALTFVFGAVLGLSLAVMLQTQIGAGQGGLVPALLVSLSEEPAKAIAASWLLLRSGNRFRMDGVVYGAAAGMGFAAFENIAYAWAYPGTPAELLTNQAARAFLSPFAQGTWTAIVCAAIWQVKGGSRPSPRARVAGAFGLSVLLHTLWEWQPVQGMFLTPWFVAIGFASIALLRGTVEQAKREENEVVLALNPEGVGSPALGPRVTCHSCGQAAPPGTHYCARCGAVLRAR